jgi:hypothetical protein
MIAAMTAAATATWGHGAYTGYLVVSADQEPSVDQRFLLTTLAQLTGAALVSAG